MIDEAMMGQTRRSRRTANLFRLVGRGAAFDAPDAAATCRATSRARDRSARARGLHAGRSGLTRSGGVRSGGVRSVLAVLFVLVGGLVFGVGSGLAVADAVRISGFWIEDVTIQSVTPEQVVYVNASGQEFTQPRAAVQGMRFTDYPQVEQANAALPEDGRPSPAQAKEAARLLREARARAEQEDELWLAHWLANRGMKLEQAHGLPLEAARSFLFLARTDAPREYLAEPPTEAFNAMNRSQLTQVIGEYRAAVGAARGAGRRLIQRVITVLESAVDDASSAGERPDAETETGEGTGGGAVGGRAAAGDEAGRESSAGASQAGRSARSDDTDDQAAAMLPSATPSNDPIAPLLREGRFEEAIEELDKTLRGAGGRMSMRLYQRGVARLALGKRRNDQRLIKDAGLDFARVVFHFPETYTWAGPSLVELAHVHQLIGETDVAVEKFREAQNLIDEEQESEYYQRLQRLQEQLNP